MHAEGILISKRLLIKKIEKSTHTVSSFSFYFKHVFIQFSNIFTNSFQANLPASFSFFLGWILAGLLAFLLDSFSFLVLPFLLAFRPDLLLFEIFPNFKYLVCFVRRT